MPANRWPGALPRLTDDNWNDASPKVRRYNCIAWAAGENFRVWWPGIKKGYWPPSVDREETIEKFVEAFGTRGYRECENGNLEDGFEKVAIFASRTPDGLFPEHAARQLRDGRWTSKIGIIDVDIEHDTAEAVGGGDYGDPVRFLKRPRRG